MAIRSRSPIHEKIEKDLPIVFSGTELQPMYTENGTVWRQARAVTGIGFADEEQWIGMHEREATLSTNSVYEHRNRVTLRRLSRPAMIAVLDMDKETIQVWEEGSGKLHIDRFLSSLNRGWAVLKLFGEPIELRPDDTPWSADEAI